MSEEEKNNSNDKKQAGYFAGGGAAAGAVTAAVVGKMGLAAMGTATAVGAAPVIIFGAVAGLAAFGVKKAFFDKNK